MFRDIARVIPPADLVNLQPLELVVIMEDVWRSRPSTAQAGDQRIPGERHLSNLIPVPAPAAPFRNVVRAYVWPHLIYAYMIENTRIYEIFRRVVHELLHGEKLGAPSAESQPWLRNTEELFYRDSAPFFIRVIESHIRPDTGATRRNAYHRMFGMDLNHGRDDNQPHPYAKAAAANNEFVGTFEELLREVWVGMVNLPATAAPRQTDDQKILDLATKIRDMLHSRRSGGNISREEFAAVAMMSWFHLTIETAALPIMRDLRVTAAGTEQALFHIAQRVGLPAHGLSRSYFEIADPISNILLYIERQPFTAAAFYTPGSVEQQMRIIINHWSTITGRDVKARKVASS